ncbi:TPA: hypothetical protein JD336_04470 [Serratia marcescens]|nr:hypothetical protein [Serratia marcescens]
MGAMEIARQLNIARSTV